MTSSDRPDVVMLVNSLAGGGAERAMVLLANELALRDYAVSLSTWSDEGCQSGSLRHLVSDAVRQARLKPERATWMRVLRIAHYLQSVGFPPLLTALPTANLVGLLMKAALGRRGRLVARIDNHIPAKLADPATSRRERRILRLNNRLLRFADAVACLNEEMAEDLKRRAPGAASRIVVIPNPAPVSWIREKAALPPHPAFVELAGGVDGQAPVIVSVGRLASQKDQTTLLRAFALLGPASDGALPRLLVLGEGPERRRLEALAAELCVSERVRMPGFVDNPYACMARARVVAQSSVYEGDSLVPAEALSCGTRVVLTAAPGVRELLRGREWLGEVVGVGDVGGLAKGMRRALAEPRMPGDVLSDVMLAERDVSRAVAQYIAALGLKAPLRKR